MARRDRTQEALDKLAADVADPHCASARAALKKALVARTNLVVAAAVRVIHEHELAGFEEVMRAAFDRAMTEPLRTDPGCRTKAAVVKALDRLQVPADDIFLAGVRHVQLEPMWGEPQDSAVTLRGMCGMALVHRRHPDAMAELARLLADPGRDARKMAADAISVNADPLVGVPLLMLRICAGEPEPDVAAECFAALLRLEDTRTFDFVAGYVRSNEDELGEAACLALGQERPDGAFAVLREVCDQSVGERRKIPSLAIAMLRSDEAWEYLLARITSESPPGAMAAIEALAVYRESPGLVNRVREAVARREGDTEELDEGVDKWFE